MLAHFLRLPGLRCRFSEFREHRERCPPFQAKMYVSLCAALFRALWRVSCDMYALPMACDRSVVDAVRSGQTMTCSIAIILERTEKREIVSILRDIQIHSRLQHVNVRTKWRVWSA
jgi:hypothetical protein